MRERILTNDSHPSADICSISECQVCVTILVFYAESAWVIICSALNQAALFWNSGFDTKIDLQQLPMLNTDLHYHPHHHHHQKPHHTNHHHPIIRISRMALV